MAIGTSRAGALAELWGHLVGIADGAMAGRAAAAPEAATAKPEAAPGCGLCPAEAAKIKAAKAARAGRAKARPIRGR